MQKANIERKDVSGSNADNEGPDQYVQNLCCALTKSLDTVEFVNRGQEKSADLQIWTYLLHMLEDSRLLMQPI